MINLILKLHWHSPLSRKDNYPTKLEINKKTRFLAPELNERAEMNCWTVMISRTRASFYLPITEAKWTNCIHKMESSTFFMRVLRIPIGTRCCMWIGADFALIPPPFFYGVENLCTDKCVQIEHMYAFMEVYIENLGCRRMNWDQWGIRRILKIIRFVALSCMLVFFISQQFF